MSETFLETIALLLIPSDDPLATLKSLVTSPVFWVAVVAAAPLAAWGFGIRKTEPKPNYDPEDTDPGLLKKHTEFRSYRVASNDYFCIRTFYRQHPQADKLPVCLPLLVFIHGLGGSAAQFGPLLTSLANVGPSLCIDLPGCGRSQFEPKNWDAYTTQALVKLLAAIIDTYRDVKNRQNVIFIGHSMGCSLAALLASRLSQNVGGLPERAVGLVALCPRAAPPTQKQANTIRRLLLLPGIFFEILRYFDKRGGTESSSVRRIVGENADIETKRLQLRFNEQSQTDVFRRMTRGLLPVFQGDCQVDGLPDLSVWASLDIPILLVSGEGDRVTRPKEAEEISQHIQAAWKEHPRNDKDSKGRPPRALKTSVLPAPASHSLFFSPSTCRTISGLIQTFMSENVDKRLSLKWQLQHLSNEGKWDVKNLAKWQNVQPISEPIAGLFRAMKTMREVDEHHCPRAFARKWAGDVSAVIDISHETPVYDPQGLEDFGIKYHKFPTVSKLPPTEEEVKAFCELTDRLRSEAKPNSNGCIAVHCHYGFNRTGFLIICYLVDVMGWQLQDAIDEFEAKRPPGVKHSYFVDSLFLHETNMRDMK